ncbi:hypothetical protein FRUB_07871 [Fimbriiglobus ruber]|uniref:Uncharacterized protein n=1 Tax=Fimbriiglobus ruber TaxID=1908690 RepID=A0A225DIE6_9BACT|nr:hypothetical protein FRUB_07871 [Fimbriiglobus ruber]
MAPGRTSRKKETTAAAGRFKIHDLPGGRLTTARRLDNFRQNI